VKAWLTGAALLLLAEAPPAPAARGVPAPSARAAPPAANAPRLVIGGGERVYRTRSETLLSLMASAAPGVPMPPLPLGGGIEEDFAAAATNTLVITDRTPEETAALMEAVAWDKAAIAEWVRQGHRAGDIMEAMQRRHNEEAGLRADAVALLRRRAASGAAAEEVREDLALINRELEERGLPAIGAGEAGLEEEEE
jgi:hypothetical protein